MQIAGSFDVSEIPRKIGSLNLILFPKNKINK
jgi:hypothetical protein